tara:strand:+ start:1814 stop:2017 length:204 start_codon:yes stop_codon:yes gene_type:complete
VARNKKTSPIKAATVTHSHGYADALRIGSLYELEKQWLYWREPARREAEHHQQAPAEAGAVDCPAVG